MYQNPGKNSKLRYQGCKTNAERVQNSQADSGSISESIFRSIVSQYLYRDIDNFQTYESVKLHMLLVYYDPKCCNKLQASIVKDIRSIDRWRYLPWQKAMLCPQTWLSYSLCHFAITLQKLNRWIKSWTLQLWLLQKQPNCTIWKLWRSARVRQAKSAKILCLSSLVLTLIHNEMNQHLHRLQCIASHHPSIISLLSSMPFLAWGGKTLDTLFASDI